LIEIPNIIEILTAKIAQLPGSLPITTPAQNAPLTQDLINSNISIGEVSLWLSLKNIDEKSPVIAVQVTDIKNLISLITEQKSSTTNITPETKNFLQVPQKLDSLQKLSDTHVSFFSPAEFPAQTIHQSNSIPHIFKSNQKSGEVSFQVEIMGQHNTAILKLLGSQPPVYFLASDITALSLRDLSAGQIITGNFIAQNLPQQGPLIGLSHNATASAMPALPAFTSQLWPTMQDILSTLTSLAPQVAHNNFNLVPSPAQPQMMGAGIVFFLAAMRSGDLSQWLGERATDILRRSGRSDLFQKLTRETITNSRQADSLGPATEWRTAPIPMMIDNNIYKMILHWRREDQDAHENSDKKGGAQRFIFDLNFPNMGALQIDGLILSKRMDMVLRTEHPLSPAMQQDIRALYTQALDHTSLYGEIGFQSQIENWVRMIPREQSVGVSI
jgi:hypothetical protein